MSIENQELATINGGYINATYLNALSRMLSTIYDFGYVIGSSIRRLVTGKRC